MNQVEYALLIQRVFLVITGLSFVALTAIMVFLDPEVSITYVWAFLIIFMLFLTGMISLLMFWWFFTIKKEILSIVQINHIIYQSLISSCVVIFLIALNQTGQLNILTFILVVIVYIFYWIWGTLK